jgi:hypothetical protein
LLHPGIKIAVFVERNEEFGEELFCASDIKDVSLQVLP